MLSFSISMYLSQISRDRQEMISRIECSRCSQHFETKIDHLTEPIDVYSLWIDAAELANRPQEGLANNPLRRAPGGNEGVGGAGEGGGLQTSTSRITSDRDRTRHIRQDEQYPPLGNDEEEELPEDIF